MSTDLSVATEVIRSALDEQNGIKDRHREAAYGIANYMHAQGVPVALEPLPFRKYRLSDVLLSPHVYHTLIRHDFFRVEDLRNLTEADTEDWPRFGIESKRELIALIKSAFGVNPSDWPTFDVFS